MASKRKPLSFPELEPKGLRAILRSADEVDAEEEQLATQNTGMPALQQDGTLESQNDGITDSQQPSMPATQNTGDLIGPLGRRAGYPKVTYRLSSEAVNAIDDAKRILRRQFKLKVSLEEIAEEAIVAATADLLANQHASILVRQLTRKMADREND